MLVQFPKKTSSNLYHKWFPGTNLKFPGTIYKIPAPDELDERLDVGIPPPTYPVGRPPYQTGSVNILPVSGGGTENQTGSFKNSYTFCTWPPQWPDSLGRMCGSLPGLQLYLGCHGQRKRRKKTEPDEDSFNSYTMIRYDPRRKSLRDFDFWQWIKDGPTFSMYRYAPSISLQLQPFTPL
jgi:hypothetical protein